MQNKYEPLELHLRKVPAAIKEVTLSFIEIERILGDRLPASAKTHRPWWGNQKDSKTRPQARAWLSAGFLVDTVNQGVNPSVRFKRALQPALVTDPYSSSPRVQHGAANRGP